MAQALQAQTILGLDLDRLSRPRFGLAALRAAGPQIKGKGRSSGKANLLVFFVFEGDRNIRVG